MLRWERKDILEQYGSEINLNQIQALREERSLWLKRPHWEKARSLLERLAEVGPSKSRISCDLLSDTVQIGLSHEISDTERSLLAELLPALLPWRKGPFTLFGHPIDSEWRSDLKWNRVAPALDPMHGKRIVDIGCNNGYYMFRALASEPELVVGLDPSDRFWFQFELLQRYVQDERLTYELLGVEHAPLFPEFFDIALLMGILYHHRSPLEVLNWTWECMKPGAQIIVENLAIPGDEPIALSPPDRYGKMRNIYLIPTPVCLGAWMTKVGFEEIEIFSEITLSPDEQRKTALAPYESLSDFLDPNDPTKTIEGYPAPLRVCVRGRRPK